MKIGIVGCGAIGSEIATACVTLLKNKTELTALYDIDRAKSEALSRLVKMNIAVKSLDALLDKAELVIESAASSVSKNILKKAVERSKDVMIMSVGGLVDAKDLLKEAEKKNIKVYLPSGALCGIDGLKAAKISKIDKVTLTTRKPPGGLAGAPYLKEKNIDIGSIKKETVIYEGNARGAIKGFPKNINVSSVLSLAGIGAEETKVKIVVSPDYTKNTHEVEIVGSFGRIATKTENVPSEKNPKTSKLAMLSAIATLKNIAGGIKIGT